MTEKKKIVPKRCKKRVADMTPEEYEANKLYRRLEARAYHAKTTEEYKQKLRDRASAYAKRKRASMTTEERSADAKRRWKRAKERLAAKPDAEKQREREKRAAIWKRYYQKDREKFLEGQRARRASLPAENQERNRAKARKRSEQVRRTRTPQEKKSDLEYKRRWINEKRASDLHFRVLSNLRARLGGAVRRRDSKKANKRTKDLVGVDWQTFCEHIERQFDNKMSWENWGKNGWHIDHIIPLAAFDLSKKKELAVASYYLNHRPMWGKDNMSKAGNMPAKKEVPIALRRKLYELDKKFFERPTYVRKTGSR